MLMLALALARSGGGTIDSAAVREDQQGGAGTTGASSRVKTGDVTFTITADGALQGGNSRMLTAPMVGGNAMVITDLRKSAGTGEEGRRG